MATEKSVKNSKRKYDGHRQRLREKFLAQGIDAFNDEEVLELLLSFATPRSDCKPAARAALAFFGSLAAVMDAPADELSNIPGIGPKNIFALHFSKDAARRYLLRRLQKKDYLTSPALVRDYLQHSLQGLDREAFVAIFLDSGHAVIESRILFEGTVSAAVVYPREVVKAALRVNAAALVVAHNHPSGRIEPSVHDRALTRSLYVALNTVHIRLLDHLIVGEGFYSFAEAGVIDHIKDSVETFLGS